MARYQFGGTVGQLRVSTDATNANALKSAPGAVIPLHITKGGSPDTDFRLWQESTQTFVAASTITARADGNIPLFEGRDGITEYWIPTTGGNWARLPNNAGSSGGGGGDVTSVAGRTGAVTLTKADVGLAAVQNLSPADLLQTSDFTTAFQGYVPVGDVGSPTAPAANKIPKLNSTGDLRLVRDPVNVLDAATKQYVDANGGGGGTAALPIHKKLAANFTHTVAAGGAITFATVTGFTATLAANTTYIASGILHVEDNGTASTASATDAKFQVVPPSGATVHGSFLAPVTSMSANGNAQARWEAIGGFLADGTTQTGRSAAFGLYGVGSPIPVWIDVEIAVGATGGDLTWQFAVNTAPATGQPTVTATLIKGSRITIAKVA